MRRFTAAAVARHSPSAVVFDLLDLEYRSGDAVCQLAGPLLREDGTVLPAQLVAQGPTADAIAPLLEPGFLLGLAKVALTDSLDQALRELS